MGSRFRRRRLSVFCRIGFSRLIRRGFLLRLGRRRVIHSARRSARRSCARRSTAARWRWLLRAILRPARRGARRCSRRRTASPCIRRGGALPRITRGRGICVRRIRSRGIRSSRIRRCRIRCRSCARGIRSTLRRSCRRLRRRPWLQKVEPTLLPSQVTESADQSQSDHHHRQLAPSPPRLFFIVQQIIQIARTMRIVPAPGIPLQSASTALVCRLIQSQKRWSINCRTRDSRTTACRTAVNPRSHRWRRDDRRSRDRLSNDLRTNDRLTNYNRRSGDGDLTR